MKHEGKEYWFNSIKSLFKNRSRWELGRWEFEARSKGLILRGEAQVEPKQIVTVTYTDPDGEKLWRNNSKTASLRLELFGPNDKRIGELTSDQGSAAEFVDRKIYSESPVRI